MQHLKMGFSNMSRIKYLTILSLLFVAFLMLFGGNNLSSLAASERPLSVPELPDYVFGQVRISGSFVPVGTNVSASCGNVIVAESTTIEDGWYDLEIPADDQETPEKDGCVSGDDVAFKIGNLDAEQSKPWISGGNTQLDLTAEGLEVFLPLILK